MRRIAAADWFRVRHLADGVTWIDEPFVKEFYRCNIWHLRGRDRDLLVDSGWGVVSLREHIPLVTERPLVAVASHTHFDHIAGHHEFAERWVHRAEAAILARPDAGQHAGRPLRHDEAFEAAAAPALRLDDLLPERCARDAAARRRRHGRPWRPGARGDPHARPLPGRHRAVRARHRHPVLGRHRLRRAADRRLPRRRPADYVRSMRRLLDLPVRVMHGGHFPSCSGERLRIIIANWLRAHDA